MSLGPWENGPNFMAAIEGGAHTGLALRGQDIASREAADRLSLAYQQLWANEQQRNENARQRMDIAAASNAARNREIDMLGAWHQAQTAGERSRLEQAQKSANALADYRAGMLGIETAKLNKPALHFGTQGEVLKEDPETGDITQLRPPRMSFKPTGFDLQSHASLLREEDALQRSLATSGPFMTDDTRLKALNRIGQIHKQRQALESKYAQPGAEAPAAGAALQPQAVGGRLKVKGPGGVTGSVPSGTTLPDGWSLAEEAAQSGAGAGMADQSVDDGLDEEED